MINNHTYIEGSSHFGTHISIQTVRLEKLENESAEICGQVKRMRSIVQTTVGISCNLYSIIIHYGKDHVASPLI